MLIDEIKTLPNEPGVYQYFDSANRLLYVGKAKILKNRVRSYFSFSNGLLPSPKVSPRIHKMLSETVHLEYIVTSSEADALILENSFIKQLKPKYNILLRDDKTYPYIFINLNDDFPRFEITRKIVKGSNIRYFGPYFSGARELLDAIYLNFALVQKKSCLKSKKACLFYQLGRCKAPCEAKISASDYALIVKEAMHALQNPNLLIERLSKVMLSYAQTQNYEQAAAVRDQIETLKNMQIKVEVDLAKLEDFEAYAVVASHSLLCAIRFSVQNGKINGVKTSIANAKDSDESTINEAYKHIILESFAPDQPFISTKIYTLDEFEDAALVEKILNERHSTRKFSIQTPKIGEKRKICEIAAKNAHISIEKYLKTTQSELLEEIANYFELSTTPYVIEAFDNSHLFGEATVGAMVRYENGEWTKQNYRHMHLSAKNDYDQMKESLSARALRFDKLSPPDLWVLDGGEAILNLACEILASSGTNIDVIAISKEKVDAKAYRAKGSAKDKIYTLKGKFSLGTDDKKLQFFQKLRDESHRFVINFHRKTKQKQDMQNSKLAQAGISAGQIVKLLNFYGSFDKIYTANLDEIANVTNKSVARKIDSLRQSET
ncbi:excinuclease ABC subunit UvrC [Campylobacter sp. RM13119]|uniref:UvrABC system protein C n=1 Tax=Campylobacter californiensis TaxID=1032243 RepID=A0ABD4JI50_9BACT|nr:excinuclease ABC subunit UvrC [Campylobacter sp. RM13119]MBE2986430.1 excinuclease ABC subunit UvrC [Campylobacter sp. RM12919]MBE2987855.1 excinuclease ABC subunit UvrC [Campylobacter sp. RM12920]MBE3605676.1 excinuclease ABC subunit UvrC [Campylobacter sp. RM13119]